MRRTRACIKLVNHHIIIPYQQVCIGTDEWNGACVRAHVSSKRRTRVGSNARVSTRVVCVCRGVKMWVKVWGGGVLAVCCCLHSAATHTSATHISAHTHRHTAHALSHHTRACTHIMHTRMRRFVRNRSVHCPVPKTHSVLSVALQRGGGDDD